MRTSFVSPADSRSLRTLQSAASAAAVIACMTLVAFAAAAEAPEGNGLHIGWAQADITPDEPVVLTGQRYARLSEGVMDPITATTLALAAEEGDGIILVSCDLISITDDLRDRVRASVADALPDGESATVVINGTHTHAAPELRSVPGLPERLGVDLPDAWSRWGVEFDAMTPHEYEEFAAERITEAALSAWESRAPGGISFGLGHAVVGHNRIMAYKDGSSRMYGPRDRSDFSHVEGWEDHAVHLLYTWNADSDLTGVIINLACPSQHDEHAFQISADFWHETREELRDRLGDGLYVLPQGSAAGDQSERVLVHRQAETRMEEITGQNRRERVAQRIADAVTSVLPYMDEHIDWNPRFAHRLETVHLTKRHLPEEVYESAEERLEAQREEYNQLREEIEANPEMREEDRWYRDISQAYAGMRGAVRMMDRYEALQDEPTRPVEVCVLRLGDIAFATNPFELYLDFGVRMQERSPAIQTFLVQLTGSGSYVAPERSVEGGAYGATTGSNVVGAEGGRELVEHTLEMLDQLWDND